jgi:AhpD family alkylhydroperoxidase
MLASKYYRKRTYGFKTFFKDVLKVIKKSSHIKDAMRSERISPQFRERIMLAITAVNGCRYCEWGHTKTALEYGCTEEEINNIMMLDFGSCNPDEVIALAFAQHYANEEGIYSDETWKKMIEAYGEQKSEDILLFIQMITVGNLLGNTFDGFGSRFKGKPPEEGHLLFELFLIISSVIIAIPMSLIFIIVFPFRKIFKKKNKK